MADSVKSEAASPYQYVRQYPQGSLYSQVVGYASPFYGTGGIENEYNAQLVEHTLPAQTFSQVLRLNPLETSRDNLTLTINPTLQKTAQTAFSQITGANKDAGVVAIDPSTGAILADYSNPTFDPNALANPDIAAEREVGFADFDQSDSEGVYPGVPLATADPYPPGSTFKVVTSTAVYNLDPALTNFNFPPAGSTSCPIRTFSSRMTGDKCVAERWSPCFPSRATRAMDFSVLHWVRRLLSKQAELFGYNSRPPIDLPDNWVATPTFPSVPSVSPPNQAYLAYSAIGQYNAKATALSNALVAAGIANDGVVMKPYLVQQITDNVGATLSTTKPAAWMTAATPQAAASVTTLMKSVVTSGTADGVGFSPSLDAAVKTGTAQTGNPKANTDDWMIGFAPANDPKIAIAVVVPLQTYSSLGAGVAGPIVKAMMNAAAALPGGN